jgi:hypothetical protein
MEKTSFECLRSGFRKYIDLPDGEIDKRIKNVFPLVAPHFDGHWIGKDDASIEPALTKEGEELFVLRVVRLMPEVKNNRLKHDEIERRIYELEEGPMFSGWHGVS